MTTRRGFLRGILAAGMAPVVVKAEIIMPVKTVIVPKATLMVPGVTVREVDLSYAVNPQAMAELGTLMGMMIVADSQREGFTRKLLKAQSKEGMDAERRWKKMIISHPSQWADIVGRPHG